MYYGRDLLAFNNSVTCPRGKIDLTLALGEGEHKRKVILLFLVILCRSSFKGILEISLLTKLDPVASPIHLKVIYHDRKGKSTIVGTDLGEIKKIKELIFKDILVLTTWLKGNL